MPSRDRLQLADVDEVARDRGRGGHRRAHEVRAAAARPGGPRSCGSTSTRSARPARGRRGSCRGTSSSPARRHSKPAALEDAVEPLRLGLRLHLRRARDDHRAHAGCDVRARDDRGGRAQVLDPRVRAGADEHAVDRGCRAIGVPGSSPCSRARARPPRARPGRRSPPGRGRAPSIGDDHARVRAPRDLRPSAGDVDSTTRVVARAGVGRRACASASSARSHASPSARPAGPRGRRTSCRRARSCPARAPRLDRHVADRHAALHRQRRGSPRRRTRSTWPVPPAMPSWPIAAEDQVLRRHARPELALEAHPHRLRPALRQRLRRQHVLDLATCRCRTRARRTRRASRCASRRRRSSCPGCVEAELRADDVDDALAAAAGREERHAELRAVRAAARRAARARAGRRAARRRRSATLWSIVASVRSGRRTRRPASRSPSNACGEVTSWTRWRST